LTGKQNNYEFEFLDYRTGPYYRMHHIVRTLWRPIIGMSGMDLYGFYVQESMERTNGTRMASVPSEVIVMELEISEATLTDMNFILEWCQLIAIPNRTKREVNQVYLVNPKHLVKEVSLDLHYMGYIVPIENQITVDELKKVVAKGTEPRKVKSGKKTKGKYRLRATLNKRVNAWLPPQERRKKLTQGLKVVIKQPVIPLKVKDLLQQELPLNGHDPAHTQLVADLVAFFDNDLTKEQAHSLVKQYGIDIVRQQLNWLPPRITNDYAPLQTFRAALKGNWSAPDSTPEPEVWHDGQLDAKPQLPHGNGHNPPADPALTEQWSEILNQLETQMTQATFDGWLKNTKLVSINDHVWLIGCENEFIVDWLENRLINNIERTVKQVIQAEQVELKFVVQPDTTSSDRKN